MCTATHFPEAISLHSITAPAVFITHRTMKSMLTTYCLEFNRDWDEGVHLLLLWLYSCRTGVCTYSERAPWILVGEMAG